MQAYVGHWVFRGDQAKEYLGFFFGATRAAVAASFFKDTTSMGSVPHTWMLVALLSLVCAHCCSGTYYHPTKKERMMTSTRSAPENLLLRYVPRDMAVKAAAAQTQAMSSLASHGVAAIHRPGSVTASKR